MVACCVDNSRKQKSMNIFVEIGNSDDGLSQEAWARFAFQVHCQIQAMASRLYTVAYSLPNSKWQNACWHFELDAIKILKLKEKLQDIAYKFRQDSIAWTEGKTEFLEAQKKEEVDYLHE